MLILYSTNALILLRSIFRVVEYAMGNDGYLMQHEVFLYLFDAAPMLLVMTAYVWKYPNEITEYLRGDRKFAAQSSDVETAYQMHVGPLR